MKKNLKQFAKILARRNDCAVVLQRDSFSVAVVDETNNVRCYNVRERDTNRVYTTHKYTNKREKIKRYNKNMYHFVIRVDVRKYKYDNRHNISFTKNKDFKQSCERVLTLLKKQSYLKTNILF